MTATLAAAVPEIMSRGDDVIANALSFVRDHLDMDVAYLSEIVGETLVFRAVDAPGFEDQIVAGQTLSLGQVYCRQILDGRLPELMPDTADFALIRPFVLTQALPIGAHVSVPVILSDGSVFGTLCCLSRRPCATLNARDLDVMHAFALLTADQLNLRTNSALKFQAKRAVIEQILKKSAFGIALQPVVQLRDQGITGYEALCRFSPVPYRPPNLWFEDAAQVGLQTELEVRVIEVALELLSDVPPGCHLGINASPATIASGKLCALLKPENWSRVVIEITEHAAIENIDALLMEIDRLRDMGALIAVDDAGAGYSGLQQIIRLRPNVIKLDMSLTRDIDKDLARRALASAMVQFAQATNARVVAEGVETEAEMNTLKQIGIHLGQGYYWGRPTMSRLVWDKARPASAVRR